MPLLLSRLPEDHDELWEVVYTITGIAIPRVKVCPNHSTPFAAFAEAYFAETPVSVWKASRGFGGKSTLLGLLVWCEAALLGSKVTVLGGSSDQSLRVHETSQEVWEAPMAPVGLLDGDPTTYVTRCTNGGRIKALTASTKSARGQHPPRLRLDEIDEMDLVILDAAQGQPQADVKKGIESQTVMSSTHHYPDKTMTAMLKRASEKGWPVHEWCWRESMGTKKNPGWLTKQMVDRKKAEVSDLMWDIEYDLQEPNFEGRAIDIEFVEQAYDISLGVFDGSNGEELEFEQPNPRDRNARYITGVDWAKDTDWTVIRTYRVDDVHWREVAYQRVGRLPWPVIVARVDERLKKWGGILVHDAQGLGSVVKDLLEYDRGRTVDHSMQGRVRDSAFTEYIAAHQQGLIRSPRIESAFNEHKYATNDDLYGKGHPGDTIIAGAIAWACRKKVDSGPLNIHSAAKESAWSMGG